MSVSVQTWLLSCTLVLWNIIDLASPLIVTGTISSKSNWVFLNRFCFDKETLGKVTFEFEYPTHRCCQNILLYFDTQWSNVYPKEEMTCRDKEAQLIVGNNQVINLTDSYSWSGCSVQKRGELEYYRCTGDRRFRSSRPRWWYIAVSNCDSHNGVYVWYNLTLTNGDSFWKKHFSADEQYILETNITLLVLFLILLSICCYVAAILRSRRLFHFTYKMFVCSLVLEVFSLITLISYYVKIGNSGIADHAVKVVGQAFHFVAHIVFLVMLILLGKGWTVTRGRISSSGQVKLGVFCTLYTICFVVLFIYESVVFDKGEVLYIYESPAGAGITVLRVIAWIWFCYGIFFTLKHYPSKASFYYPFWLLFTMWFLSGPVMVLTGKYAIEKWMRAQIVNGISWGISLFAHSVFLAITRPSAANDNFPFHLRTCQIGADEQGVTRMASGHAYQPQVFIGSDRTNFSDVTSMFMASSEAAGMKNMDNQGIQNNTQNGTQNGALNGGVAQGTPQPMAQLSLSTLQNAPPYLPQLPPYYSDT